ncbi:MAG: ribonuclease R [bacterium]
MKKDIKAFFKSHPNNSYKLNEIADEFDITEFYAYSEFKETMSALTAEGYLQRIGKKFSLKPVANIIVGEFESCKGLYGFVKPMDGKINDVYIHSHNINGAMNGDIVEAVLNKKGRGKSLEGEIIKIIKRGKQEYTGTVEREKEQYFVRLEELGNNNLIHIKKASLNGAKNGERVIVEIFEDAKDKSIRHAKIIDVLGKKGEYDTELATIARELGLPNKFPESVLTEAGKFNDIISNDEIKNRLDLRSKNVFTIDPDDAKDFDDALSFEILENGNYLIGIHIADVSHYVDTDGAIYKEAFKRGTSIYFVGKVIPMLPEHLSNKICSLVPNEDRLTFSVMVEFTPRGKVINYEISKSIINSKRRYTYEEVQEILETKKGDFADELINLNKIALILRRNRMKKGSINFFSSEVKFVLDEKGKPIEIQIKKIQESNELVEDYMLLANQIIAKHVNIKREKTNFVYRIHDKPDKDKIKEFARFVKTFGYSFDPASANTSQQFQKLFDEIAGTDDSPIINDFAIRSMAKAIYSTENIGHYGLAFPYYSHFTSPIRRFPDLIVHKLIFNYLNDRRPEFTLAQLEEISAFSSERERAAQNAERISVKLKQIEFLSSKIGDEFHAVISGLTHFGMFIEINDILADGLIRLKDMQDDFYIYDEVNFMMVGKDKKKKFKLGDKVIVQLVRVNKERKELDFILSD